MSWRRRVRERAFRARTTAARRPATRTEATIPRIAPGPKGDVASVLAACCAGPSLPPEPVGCSWLPWVPPSPMGWAEVGWNETSEVAGGCADGCSVLALFEVGRGVTMAEVGRGGDIGDGERLIVGREVLGGGKLMLVNP
jgi:hypothetical protein